MESVAELRQKLVELGLTTSEAESIKGKDNLKARIEELSVDKESEEMLDEAEETKEINDTLEVLKENDRPNIYDPEWSEYVLSHLREEEKIKGHPKADSLRRLTELLIGDVMDVDTNVVQCPSMENGGRATVIVTIEVNPHKISNGYSNMRMSGSADVYPGNTDTLFSKFPVATAETRAEGRAYRKILRLQNVVAAEELQGDNNQEQYETIDVAQIMMINQMCSKAKLDIDVVKLLDQYDIKVENLDKVSKTKAQEICKLISSFQETGVPENLVGYKNDWR